jgi:hypothetical protein
MREITKTLMIPVDGKKLQFRLTKLDAFSGVSLIRMLSQASFGEDFLNFFSGLSDEDMRRLMTVCLEHCEVLLPAGWNPVMTLGEWSYIELEHDIATCMKLTVEEVLWTLEGFFGGGASGSRPGTPDS